MFVDFLKRLYKSIEQDEYRAFSLCFNSSWDKITLKDLVGCFCVKENILLKPYTCHEKTHKEHFKTNQSNMKNFIYLTTNLKKTNRV